MKKNHKIHRPYLYKYSREPRLVNLLKKKCFTILPLVNLIRLEISSITDI